MSIYTKKATKGRKLRLQYVEANPEKKQKAKWIEHVKPSELKSIEVSKLSKAEAAIRNLEIKAAYKNLLFKRGVKEYTINGSVILARTHANAIRKSSQTVNNI